MSSRLRHFLVGLFALAMFAAAPGGAQVPESRGYSQEELDQLLAPIALYPDQLLMQVLIASTYPLEVIEAARFVQQNPNLRGEALDNALAGRNWDPSVQSLAGYPQVLEMMNEKLDWMQRLGDAFLVDQQRMMDTVQALRARAQATGALESTTQQSVVTQDRVIIIEPAQPDYLYVPVYNPLVVYGPWWAPAYEPWFWYPPVIYGYPVWGGIAAGIYFGSAWALSYHHWGWAYPDWHGHHVNIRPGDNRFWNRPGRPPPSGGNWQHEPGHRRGIAYPDPSTYERYRRTNPDAVRSRQEFRARDNVQHSPNVMRPSPGTARPGIRRRGTDARCDAACAGRSAAAVPGDTAGTGYRVSGAAGRATAFAPGRSRVRPRDFAPASPDERPARPTEPAVEPTARDAERPPAVGTERPPAFQRALGTEFAALLRRPRAARRRPEALTP